MIVSDCLEIDAHHLGSGAAPAENLGGYSTGV
jgi:hypothetical protein